LTVATVQTHRTTIMHKLGVSSVAELVRYAVRNKIIEA
jgi:DNA-binding CsgD family transcriptional regulator